MSIMPAMATQEELTRLFRGMRCLFDQLRQEAVSGVEMRELSMGMSGDYILAAQEGATHVRIGSAIFGSRALGRKQEEISLEGDIHS